MPSRSHSAAASASLFEQWQRGVAGAFDALVERYLPFLEAQVRRRLGGAMRGRAETQDYVQDVLVEVLRYCPRAMVENEAHFRNLLLRVVENHLRDRHDWLTAQRRDTGREEAMPSDSSLPVQRPRGESIVTPSRVAVQNEHERWLRLALHLLNPDDRRVILLREWEKLSFHGIAERLGTTAEAARKRFHRALPRLLEKVTDLQKGRLPDAPRAGA